MPFFPNDIKALVSLMWAHSTIQSNVIFEGNRCNKKNPDKDKYGRYIDVTIDRDDTTLLPRCADVHPGILHVSMVNLLGIEGRSFVVDHNPTAAIANQPVSGYELYYFNPKDGKEGLAIALSEKPDLILLDILMPVMDGLTMMEVLRNKNESRESVGDVDLKLDAKKYANFNSLRLRFLKVKTFLVLSQSKPSILSINTTNTK
jgi:CheY-like chemotaxis protein